MKLLICWIFSLALLSCCATIPANVALELTKQTAIASISGSTIDSIEKIVKSSDSPSLMIDRINHEIVQSSIIKSDVTKNLVLVAAKVPVDVQNFSSMRPPMTITQLPYFILNTAIVIIVIFAILLALYFRKSIFDFFKSFFKSFFIKKLSTQD